MLRYFLCFVALLLVSPFLSAQITIAGAKYDLGTATINVVRWNANNGALLDSVPTPIGGIAIGSSVFDAFQGNYYFSSGNGLNGVDFGDSTFTAYAGTQISNSAEIDMASGKIFGVRNTSLYDSNGTFLSQRLDMLEYNISNNTQTVMGTFAGNRGVYLDASCYNSNQGIYYFIGLDSTLGQCLYAVNTTASVFAFTFVPLNSPGVFAQTLEYDNEYNILYALMIDNSGPGNSHFLVQKIDPWTGIFTLEVDFPQFSSYQIGSCSFDQTTSSMVFVFPDTSAMSLRIYNTVTNTLTNGILPLQFINEFECDNTAFAASKYNTTAVSVPQSTASITLFPNPATTELRIAVPEQVRQLQVIDALGQMTPLQAMGDMNKVDVSRLSPGYYTLRSQLADGSWTQGKFIKL
jgi:hypothetical protein